MELLVLMILKKIGKYHSKGIFPHLFCFSSFNGNFLCSNLFLFRQFNINFLWNVDLFEAKAYFINILVYNVTSYLKDVKVLKYTTY